MKTNGAFKSSLIDINVTVLRTTERAALVEPAFRDGEPSWVPLSQVELSRNEGTSTHLMIAPEWLLREKGWV